MENAALFRPTVSNTFHGQDIFAPVAAHLVRGLKFSLLGPKTDSVARLRFAEPGWRGNTLAGEVIYVDRFGNLITNIPAKQLPKQCQVRIGGRLIAGLSQNYAAVPQGRPFAVINSLQLLEVGCREDNLARRYRLGRGSALFVTKTRTTSLRNHRR